LKPKVEAPTAERSAIMRAVKSRDTSAEIKVRKIAYAAGFRYRLNGESLPGKPDMVFWGRKKAIFVHGCFWHGHTCKRGDRLPASNVAYWTGKIARNKERDARVRDELAKLGWRTLTIWECWLKDRDAVLAALNGFLDG
jgi:DNA mismatch endonuclease, patch repair protein